MSTVVPTADPDEIVEVPPPTDPAKSKSTTPSAKELLEKLKPHHKLFLDPYAPEIYETRKKSVKRKCTDAQELEDKAHEQLCAQYPDELVPAGDFLASVKLYFKNKMRKYRERDEEQAATQAKATTSNASGTRQATIEEVLLPKVTAKSLYKFENHEEIVEVAVEKAGKDNKRNPAEYQKTRKAGYESLPVETKQDYEERARRMNEESAAALGRPATDEEIIQNQLKVRDRIKEFLEGLIGEGYLQIGGDASFHLESTYACRRDGGVPVGFVLDVSGKSIPSFTKSRYYKKNGNGYAEFSDVVFRKLLEKRRVRAGPSHRNTIDLTDDGEPSSSGGPSRTERSEPSTQDGNSTLDSRGPVSMENAVSETREATVSVIGATNDVGVPSPLSPIHDVPEDEHTNSHLSDQIPASLASSGTVLQNTPTEKTINTGPQDPITTSEPVSSHLQSIAVIAATSNTPANLVNTSPCEDIPANESAAPSSEPHFDHHPSSHNTVQVSNSTSNGADQISPRNETAPAIEASKEQTKTKKRTK
ncbi:hypothetical protein SCHPADRAFT_947837, partial [Schizopora paradoxa]